MLEVYFKDKKRTKDLEAQLDDYNKAINATTKRIEYIRTTAGRYSINVLRSWKLNLFYSKFRHEYY
jgi:rapamycin-insensitive companion of mTOR